MARVNVFLSDQLLDEIDRQAKEEGINRSALIQAAVEKYIEVKRRGRDEEAKRRKMQEASRKMDALSKKLGEWEPQTTIRKFRDIYLGDQLKTIDRAFLESYRIRIPRIRIARLKS